ncbi:ABC transporter substrate-binding protein [Pediococcus parvulus]|uniref:ABC transporter substrate-binding protein n=1 Tax=Pediococcus parvulus TaxID=54062 RepID=UPI00345F0815
MKKSTKLLIGLTSMLSLSLLLVGCGKSSQSKTTIQFFSTKTENASTYKQLISEFEKKNPKIKVQLSSPTNAGTVLKTDLAKNTVPDVMAVGGDTNYQQVQKAGVLEDLSSESFTKTTMTEYQKMITSISKGGKLDAVPYATNASGVVYNKTLFAKAGIKKTPTTWNELIADAKILKAHGITPFELPFQDSWTTMGVFNQLDSNMISGNWIDKRLNNKTTYLSSHKAVMQKYLTISKYAQKDYMGTSYNDGTKALAEGKAAMMINGNFVIPQAKQLKKNVQLDMFKLPVNNDSSKNKVTSGIDVAFAISKKSKSQAADKKFVKFLMSKKSSQLYNKQQFSFSAVKGVTQNATSLKGISSYLSDGDVVNYPDHYYPDGFDMTSVLTQTGLNQTKGMSDSKNITQTLKKADKAFNSANVKD